MQPICMVKSIELLQSGMQPIYLNAGKKSVIGAKKATHTAILVM